jgi:hypothetical protein
MKQRNRLRTAGAAALGLLAACASAQQVYVANDGDGTIQRYSTNGTWLGDFANTGTAGPLYLAWQGNYMYVAAYNDDQILEYNRAGQQVGVFADTISNPKALLFDSSGDLYVSTLFGPGNDSVIQEFAPNGTLIQNIDTIGLRSDQMGWGPNGDLDVADFINSDIQEYNPTTGAYDGEFTDNAMSGIYSEGPLAFSGSYAYTANTFSSEFYELDSAGDVVTSWYNPSQPGQAGGAMENFTIGPNGTLYAVDSASDNIWMYGPGGTSLGLFSGSHMNDPYDMAFGPNAQSSVPAPAAAIPFALAALIRRRRKS